MGGLARALRFEGCIGDAVLQPGGQGAFSGEMRGGWGEGRDCVLLFRWLQSVGDGSVYSSEGNA
jgi:hypothetical protein